VKSSSGNKSRSSATGSSGRRTKSGRGDNNE
jgi:hypothetical protein